MLTVPDILSAILHRLHSLLSTLLLFIVSLGPIPRHVGFVMDGNRRYAKGRGRQVAQGHSDGFDSLKRVSDLPVTRTTPLGVLHASMFFEQLLHGVLCSVLTLG